MKLQLVIVTAALIACLPASDAQSADKVSRAIDGFILGCLSAAPNYPNWKATFHAAGITSGNRANSGLPPHFPAGDAITDPKVVRKNIGDPVVADCAVQIEGDQSALAVRKVKEYLNSPAFPLKKPSPLQYTASSTSERVVYHQAFLTDGRSFSVLIQIKNTLQFGRLTTLNATVVNAR